MTFNLTSKTKLLSKIIFLLERLCTLSPDLRESITDVSEITNSEIMVEKEKLQMSLREVLQQKLKEKLAKKEIKARTSKSYSDISEI